MTATAGLANLSLNNESSACADDAGLTDGSLEEVTQNQALLSRIFTLVDSLETLVCCASVCKLWHSVAVGADDIWKNVYLAQLPEPQDYEYTGSYRQQFRRLKGLLQVSPPQPTALKGSALCYNAATGHLVSYNSRQRLVSVQLRDGTIKSEQTDIQGAATAHKPLLASTGCELVVLAAFDGPLQLWDAGCCQPVGLLGSHPSFITSLDASGDLVASTCSAELRLWQLSSRQCLFQVPIGLPMPSPVLEPHVAVCHSQQLLALANCAAPAPSSVVKVYSTQPAGSRASSSSGSSSTRGSATGVAAAQQQQPAGSVTVGSSGAPDAAGALLLRELPVNAAADMLLLPGLLLVASCFHGRAVSSNTPYKSERPFTVVVQVWDTQTWQLTRLVSPRLWTDYPIYTMQGTPLIALTQGMLLCATLRSGITRPMPSCCIHAWQLPRSLIKPARPPPSSPVAAAAAAASDAQQQVGNGNSGAGVCMLSVSPGKISGIGLGLSLPSSGSSSSTRAGNAGGGSSSGSSRDPEPYGEGAMALGRAAVATAGGAGSVGVSASHTVMLAVSDQDRDQWVQLVEDTEGRLTVMLTTPTQLVVATDLERVLSSRLVPEEPAAAAATADLKQQQQDGGSGTPVDAAPPSTGATQINGHFIIIDA